MAGLTAPAPTALGSALARYLVLAQAALSPTPGRVVISPGTDPAWDECCEGFLYARVISIAPAVSPIKASGTVGPGCGVIYWNATVAIGVLRCAAVVNDQGVSPTEDQITFDGLTMLADMVALEGVILCSGETRSVVQWVPVGVEGGCHGGEWQFVISTNPCPCPEVTP